MSTELPQGWAETTVGEIAEDISYGFTAKATTSPVGPRLLRITDIQNGSVQWDSVPYCEIPKGKSDNYSLRNGDIVFARTGATTGKSFRIRSCPEAVFASYLIRVRPSQSTLPEFLAHFFQSASYWNQISENLSGSAQPNCNASKLATISLPLAPLAEQRRIVAKLETLLGKVDASQKRLAKIPGLLKRFRQSVLAAACSGRLTADWREENPNAETPSQVGDGEPPDNFELPNSWRWLLSAHAFDFVTSGSRGWARYYADNGPIFLRVGNLDHDSIQLDLQSIQHVRPPDNAEGKRTRVQLGDLLVSVTADVGMVALVETDIGEAYINQHVALARPNGSMDKRYLAYFLSAKNGGQHQFQNLQRGATKVGLGLDDIKAIWIAHPPLPEQQEIVRRVEGLFALADQLEERLAKARGQVDTLTPSLLARAFAGQLVPQDPTDEPAEKLLERITGRKMDNER